MRRITRLDTIRIDELPNILLVQVHTADGLVGLGETYFGAATVEAYLHEIVAPYLLGRDPVGIADIAADLVGYLGFSSTGAETRGNSAVDIALWDIAGQSAGLPLHEMFGGTRTEIPVYNTCAGYRYVRDTTAVTPDNFGLGGARGGPYEDLDAFLHRADELAESLLSEGVRGMKIWPFDDAARESRGQYIGPAELRDALVPFEKIRSAVGDRMEIMVELHGLWNVVSAERIAAAVQPFHPRWIEDPVRPDNTRALGRVARSTRVPIAAGETLAGLDTFERLIDEGGVSVAIVDLGWGGGISEALRVAALATSRSVEVAFHDCNGPVVLAASTHLALATPNAAAQEIVRAFYHGWYGNLVTALPPIEDGRIRAPHGPGLGLALHPDLPGRPGVRVRTSGGNR